jgi:hypothetical protein
VAVKAKMGNDRRVATLTSFVFYALVSIWLGSPGQSKFGGFLPDQKTAQSVSRAMMIAVKGQEYYDALAPWHVEKVGTCWMVYASGEGTRGDSNVSAYVMGLDSRLGGVVYWDYREPIARVRTVLLRKSKTLR